MGEKCFIGFPVFLSAFCVKIIFSKEVKRILKVNMIYIVCIYVFLIIYILFSIDIKFLLKYYLYNYIYTGLKKTIIN